jgi:hypothetical protein
MIHDSTWHIRARAMCRKRAMAPVGFLLACALVAALPAAAFATAPEVRGEWELLVQSSGATLKGKTLITEEADGEGKFAGPTHGIHFEDGGTGTFSGTLEGGKASVLMIADPIGSFPVGEFASSTMTVEEGPGTLALSGEGTITVSGKATPNAIFTATRIKSQKQIEEQEAQEKKEREEREAKERVRGEWALTFEAGPQVVKGTALVTNLANSKEEFASSSAVFESVIPGTFSGTVMGSEASVTITTQAAGPFPGGTFTGTKLAVTVTSNSMTIAGEGTLTPETPANTSFPAMLTATRIRTYQEVTKEREAKEKEEREAKETTEREAREKTEREASEKAAREAKEKQDREALEAKQKTEREANEKAALLAKEKAEREAREAAEKAALANAKLVSAQLPGKALTVSASELLSLQLTNPNPYAVSGHVTLVAAQSSGKSSASKGAKGKKGGSLGSASFTLSPNGEQVVKLKLSQRGRAELARHKTLRVLATVTTQASGKTTTSKTFSLTLHAAKATHGKH